MLSHRDLLLVKEKELGVPVFLFTVPDVQFCTGPWPCPKSCVARRESPNLSLALVSQHMLLPGLPLGNSLYQTKERQIHNEICVG